MALSMPWWSLALAARLNAGWDLVGTISNLLWALRFFVTFLAMLLLLEL